MIRDCTIDDLATVQILNESVVPAVNSLSIDDLRWFMSVATFFRVAELNGEVVAFLIGLNQGVDYASPNYQWFSERYVSFAYVDRVAVSVTARRMGLAAKLYADFEASAARESGRLVCEVNLRPANEGSMLFHKREGFEQIGAQENEGGAKQVALMLKELG